MQSKVTCTLAIKLPVATQLQDFQRRIMQGLEAEGEVFFLRVDGYSNLRRGDKLRNGMNFMIIASGMLLRRHSPGLGAELTWPR